MARILDLHQHIGPRDRITGSDGKYDFTLAAEKHLRMMDSYGIAEACLIPSHTARFAGPEDIRRLNESVAEVRAARPDRFVACAGTVEPALGDAGLAEIQYCIDELRVNAMAWHCQYSGMNVDAPPMKRYVGFTAEAGVTILMHMLAECSFESGWRVGLLAEEFPSARIIGLDAFTSLEQIEWIVSVGGRYQNLMFDLAVLRSCSTYLEKFVEKYGPGRLMFGSNYYDDAGPRAPAALCELDAARLPEQDKDAILGGNARRVLGLG